MASMRDIKQRITATRKTSQITKAMHMVSASKLRKAERSIYAFRPLAKRLSKVLSNVLSTDSELTHPMLEARDIHKTAYIIISSDRGLAGPYNNNTFKAFQKHIDTAHERNDEFVIIALGFKAFNFAKRNGYTLMNEDVIQVRDDIQFVDFQPISDRFIKAYLSGEVDKIDVFYNEYINTLTQNVNHQTLVPLESNPFVDTSGKGATDTTEEGFKTMYVYEPSPSNVLYQLMPMYVVNTLYGMILESKASEHASRMTAMKSATDNAKDLIETLQLKYNRARQNAITIELTDIIGGSEAVN